MLRIQLLGGLHISLNGMPMTGFVSSKAQALFCYVTLNHHQPHLRATLASMFWGEMPDEDAATNLRQAIANLKRLLEPYIEITRQSIAFKTEEDYWLDVEAFERDHESMLYRGELLAGFNVPDAPEFDLWLSTERERLHELALSFLRAEASSFVVGDHYEEALSRLNRLLALDPLQEDAHRQLMRLHAMNGQRSAALSQYETCRDVLRRELDVEPEHETQRLYERVKVAQRIVHLPSETTPLIGREAELAELQRHLADPTCHLISIIGLGGIGKTRLALRLVHQQATRTLHGAAMVNLTSITTLQAFFNMLADALHFTLSQETNPRLQLLNYLREKHLLLLLDNFEQLTTLATEFVNELIRTAPEIKIVVTSREKLNVRGEWSLALHGLPYSASDADDEAVPALALFWATARRVRGDDLLTAQSAAAVRRICQLVDGMPLAIELAAGWSMLLTCEELADEIASNLTALETTTNDTEERHRSLRAVFDHSWQLFSTREQIVLMTLSTFVAGFTRDAAEKVASAPLTILMALANKLLLRREAQGRFTIHEMTRQYLVQKLDQSEQREHVWKAYLDYYQNFAHEAEPRLRSSEQRYVLKEIANELENIHTAWRVAVVGKRFFAIGTLIPLIGLYHDMNASWAVGEALLLEASSLIMEANQSLRGAWLANLALLCSRQEDKTEATRRYAEQSFQLLSAEDAEQMESVARAFIALGYAESILGNYEEALRHFLSALELRTKLGDEWGCAQAILRLASVNGRLWNFTESATLAGQGLELSKRVGDQFLTSRFQMLLAISAAENGDLDRAQALHEANLATYEEVDNLEGRGLAINGLAVVAYYRKNFALARRLTLEALAIVRQLGSLTWEANALNNLGEFARDEGDAITALDYFKQSLEIFQRIGNKQHGDIVRRNIESLKQGEDKPPLENSQ